MRSKCAHSPLLIHFSYTTHIPRARGQSAKSGVLQMHEALCSRIGKQCPAAVCDIRVGNCRLRSRTFFRAIPQRRKKKIMVRNFHAMYASCFLFFFFFSLCRFFFCLFILFSAGKIEIPRSINGVTDIRVRVVASVHG